MSNSILRSAEILKIIFNGTNRLTDISHHLNIKKSTTHRLLKTLEISGFVIQDPITRKYLPGYLILKLASNSLFSHQMLIAAAYDEMNSLRRMSRETILLHVRIGAQRICLEEMESEEDIKYTTGKGSIGPIYAGSAGKLLLSEMENQELELLLQRIKLLPIGPKTITNRKELIKELATIKTQGYAISVEERYPGGMAISVPIKDYICPVALSIMGPYIRFEPKMSYYLKEIKKSALKISKQLK